MEFGADAIEVAPVQFIELAERDAALAHLLHCGLVFVAPSLREIDPVEFVASGFKSFLASRAMPPRQSTTVPKISKNSAFASTIAINLAGIRMSAEIQARKPRKQFFCFSALWAAIFVC